MIDPCLGVRDILVEAGIGSFGATSGWSINIGVFPNNPDTAILVNRTGGRNPFPNLRLNFPSIQVMVRGNQGGYEAASTKMAAVVEELLGRPSGKPTAAGVDWWMGVLQIGDIAFLGLDENKRPILTANFSLFVEPQSGKYRAPIG